MDGEVTSDNSRQMNNHLSDIIVLLLDGDSACSGIVAKMLKTHNYEVLHFRSLNDAFGAVRDTDKALKLIFTSISFPDSKGCASFRRVAVMPVALGGGVTVYHFKNVNMSDIEDIWGHIFIHKQRKKSAIDTNDNASKNSLYAATPAPADSTSTSAAGDSNPGQTKGSSRGAGQAKKDRVVWTIELNNRFIEAYNLLGHQGATPCRILELMNEQRLTRFHIASHLQKYRTHLREKQEELNTRRSKFRYNVNDPNFCSGTRARISASPQPERRLGHGSVARSVAVCSLQPPVNPAESFTRFLTEMEDEELFALAQSQSLRIPFLSPASSRLSLDQDDTMASSDSGLAQPPDKFDDTFSMLQDCVSGDTFRNSYVGFKISDEGELLLWDNAAAGQAAAQPQSQDQGLLTFSSADAIGSPLDISLTDMKGIGIDSLMTYY